MKKIFKKIVEKINFKNIVKILTIIIIFILCYIMTRNPLGTTSDDLTYKNAFCNLPTFFSWVKYFASTWGGRVIASGISTIFLNINIAVYKIINASVIFILIYLIYKFIEINDEKIKKYKNIILLFSMFLFLTITKNVLNESVVWVTGSFNYLWPTAAMLITLIPYVKLMNSKKINIYENIFYFLCMVLVSNVEQTGAILIAFSTISLIVAIIKKEKISKFLIFSYVVSIVIFIITLAMPGNDVRYTSELLRYYQDFDMLSLSDKIFQGVGVTLNHLVNRSSIIFLIISIMLVYIAVKNKNKSKILMSLIVFIYFLFRIIPFNSIFSFFNECGIEKKINSVLYTFASYDFNTICNPKLYSSTIIGVIILLLIAVLSCYSCKNTKKLIVYVLIYLAGICASLALSISPTIFASGSRIFFVNDIMNILFASSILGELLCKKNNQQK